MAAIAEGRDRDWAMNQHRQLVAIDDPIVFWQSGKAAAVVATGRVSSTVYARESDFGRWGVDVIYDAVVEPPLTRQEVLADDVLHEQRVFQGAQGTNFILPEPTWQSLEPMLRERLRPLRPAGPGDERPERDLDAAIRRYNGMVRKELLRAVSEMPPERFEWLVGKLLETLGYDDVVVTKYVGDKGIDVRATLKANGMAQFKTVVQAKRWGGTVPPDEVRKLRGALAVGESGLIITTGNFSKAAREDSVAAGRQPIGLVDGEALVDILMEAGIGVERRTVPIYALNPAGLEPAALEAPTDSEL